MRRLWIGTLIFVGAAVGPAHAQQNQLRMPNVSGNALFLYRNSNFSKEETQTVRNGIDLQEAELAFYADVDPYSRLYMLLAVHPEYELDAATNKVEQEWAVEPEELFAETEHIPRTTLKLGKFKAAFGKHNLLHTHAFPFVDAPLANTLFLGDEGLNDIGLSAAVLLPSAWFSEVTLQYLKGEGENEEFKSPSPNDAVGVAHWKNLLELSDSATLEAGGSMASGKNFLDRTTHIWGGDLTLKWRPTEGGRYRSWILGSEYIRRELGQSNAFKEIGEGLAIWGQYQFLERWATNLRWETLKVQNSEASVNSQALDNTVQTKSSIGIIFSATEFSSYRFEYNWRHVPLPSSGVRAKADEHKLYLQANFTIGAHPSHAY